MNALDEYDADRLLSWGREADDLASLGYDAAELDLRDPGNLVDRLASADLTWVVGGNAFVLARAMATAEFRHAFTSIPDDERPTYAGYSAGACVAGPDLAGIDLIDDPGPSSSVETLEFITERIVPHWRSEHPEAPAAELVVAELTRRGLAHVTLRDGDDHLVGW